MARWWFARRLQPVRIVRTCCYSISIAIILLLIFNTSPWSLFTRSGNRQNKEQILLNYMSENMHVYYRVLSNSMNQYHTDVTLTNRGPITIPRGNWTLYFHHLRFIDIETFNYGGDDFRPVNIFTLHHVNSYLFALKPTKFFPNLTKDEYVTFRLTQRHWLASRSDIFPNWYVSFDRNSQVSPRVLQCTQTDDVDFVSSFDKNWRRAPGDMYEPYDPPMRYMKNKVKDFKTSPNLILPTPLYIKETSSEKIQLTSVWTIVHQRHLASEAKYLSLKLGIKSVASHGFDSDKYLIHLLVDPTLMFNGSSCPETYELTVGVSQITIRGRSQAGVFYGIQSLLHLVPVKVTLPVTLAAVTIRDQPRLPYRGLMLDVVRNFFHKDVVFDLIDLMAQYKMNRLHLHLSDDEGWRLQIPGLPELTQVGGQRCHDLKELVCLLPMLGSGPYNNTSGSGFYTVSDYQQILSYARHRHVTVLPEFDMPGHSHAAIKSMESRYYVRAAQGEVEEAVKFLLSDLKDTSLYYSGQFFIDSALNPCLESTYAFVEHVMTALIQMHKDIQPLRVFHFGGDEVPEAALKMSPACKEFLEKNPQISGTKELKMYFVRRVAEIASKLGIGLQGWEDAFSTSTSASIPPEELNLSEVISNAWYHIWGSNIEGNTYSRANEGYKVVLTSTSHLYFDNPQEPDPDDWGLSWATRYVDTKRTFFYSPRSFYDNIDFGFWGERLSKDTVCSAENPCPPLKKPENIIGMSGALWSEEVRSPERLDAMLWPRMLALAERAWHEAPWESLSGSEHRTRVRAADWQVFANTVGHQELLRLDQQNVSYYIPLPGLIFDNGVIHSNAMFPGLQTQWSKDNSRWYNLRPDERLSGKVYFSTLSADGRRRSRSVVFHVPTE